MTDSPTDPERGHLFDAFQRRVRSSLATSVGVFVIATGAAALAHASREELVGVIALASIAIAVNVGRLVTASRTRSSEARDALLRREARWARVQGRLLRVGIPPFLLLLWVALVLDRRSIHAAYLYGNVVLSLVLIAAWIGARRRRTA